MQNEMRPTSAYGDEVDVKELFSILWAGKNRIVAMTAVFALASVFYALSIANEFRATAVISPSQGGGSSMLGSMAAQFGGLASLAGINIGGNSSGESDRALEIMTSQSFIVEFIEQNDLAVPLFAAEGWNRDSNQLEINADLYDSKEQRWLRDSLPGRPSEPSSWELYQAFLERLSVVEENKGGLVVVSIEYFSPEMARDWVDTFITAINEHMRQRKLMQVNRNIEYLEAQIQKTAIADMREVFYQVIEEQIKSKMLAEASPEYVFSTVNRPMLPEIKSKPSRALICVLLTLLGAVFGGLFVLFQHYLTISKLRS